MFKSLKKKPEKVKEKTDFKLSFHATRVPVHGWDKLVISVIPYETGRPVAKTPRAVVKNGTCQWPDSIIESTRLLYDTKTREYEEKKYKFIVSSGSSRSGVLGEVTVNLGEFAASKNAQQRALPLKSCTTGTVLHINVTCLTARLSESGKDSDRAIKLRNDADEEEGEVGSDDESQAARPTIVVPSNGGHLKSPRKVTIESPPLSPVSPGAKKLQQRHVSQSSLRYSSSSFDSLEVPSTPGTNSFNESVQGYQGENISPSSSFASVSERVDASPAPSFTHKRTLSSSATSGGHEQSKNVEQSIPSNWGSQPATPQGSTRHESTSKANLEAAESTIEELRMEVTTSQRQARKLTGDVQQLSHKLDTTVQLSKEQEMELSALVSERDGLKQEVEQLKMEKQAFQDQVIGENKARWSVEEAQRVIQELKEEIMLEKTTINNLNSELHKTQQSNSELVSEIDDLLKAAKNVETLEPYVPDDLVKQVESEWSEKVAAKEGEIQKLHLEITRLEARNLQVQKNASVPAGDSSDVLVSGLQNMVRQLQQDVEELEADTIRLADENTDLQAKLESSRTELNEKCEIQSAESILSRQFRQVEVGSETAEEGRAQLLGKIASLQGELSMLKEEAAHLLDEREETENMIHLLQVENEELKKTKNLLEGGEQNNLGKEREVANGQLLQQLADTVTGLEGELQDSQEECRLSRLRIEELEHEILTSASAEDSNSSMELETLRKLLDSEKLEKESIQRRAEEKVQLSQERLKHALEELEYLAEQMDSLEMQKRTAETRCSELEAVKSSLDSKLADLESEKLQTADHVSGLQLQLKYMTKERDLHQQEAGVVEEEKSYLLSEKVQIQATLDATLTKHQELVKHLRKELSEVTTEHEISKSSQCHLGQEVEQLQRELKEAKQELQIQTQFFESTRALLEDRLDAVTRDHTNAVAISTALGVQVAKLQNDLEDMEVKPANEMRNLSMLKDSAHHQAEKVEDLQKSPMVQKEKVALENRIRELELALEDEHNERTLYTEQLRRPTSNGNVRSHSRSISRSSNGHEAHEEDAINRVNEIEKLKQEFKQKEIMWLTEIESLELANEQLAEGPPDSDLQQLQMELTRLHNQNAASNRLINELQSKLTTQEMLQSELERLQEVNEKLEARLQKYKVAAAGNDMVERVLHLETELAEAMEANNMYKLQLRSAFAEQQNVHAVALQNFGDVDTVVNDLVGLRKRVKQLEGELRDMRDRYSSMSLRFAEVEVEREELVMTIRNLRNGRRQ